MESDPKLCGLLRYVGGDYQDPTASQAIRRELGAAKRPAFYLAIPPLLFGRSWHSRGSPAVPTGPYLSWGTTPLLRRGFPRGNTPLTCARAGTNARNAQITRLVSVPSVCSVVVSTHRFDENLFSSAPP